MSEETYEIKIVEICQDLALKYKDGGVVPTHSYRTALGKFGYTFHETLGEGAFAKVKRAYCEKLHASVAVKVIQKSKLPKEAREKFLPREIALLQKLRHHSLLVLHEVYESRCNLYLVMEYLPNGDLLDYVNKVGSLSEADGRRIFHQLLDVVSYLHEQKVYHRDIKLDNILLDECYNIRLTDFGFARFNPANELMSTFCGSYAYAAPEILDGEKYSGEMVDIWSTGVCLYGMLNGRLPFRDDDVDILRNTMDTKIKFHKHVSRDCRDLIRSILNTDVTCRVTIPAIRKSNWMCKPISSNNNDMSMSVLSVKAVTSEIPEAKLDPNAEHGFNCAQHSQPFKTTKVTDILQSVAVNHSTGSSSISLRDVVPAGKVSSTAMAVGVRGPAGRRISVQLGVAEFSKPPSASRGPLEPVPESKPQKDSVKWAGVPGAGGEEPAKKMAAGGGASKFKKAATAINRFKTAVRVVTAMRKLKRGPLSTILTIPQDQAMAKIITTKHDQKEHELKDIRFSSSAKVADTLGSNRRRMSEEKCRSRETADAERKIKQEKLQSLGATFTHLCS